MQQRQLKISIRRATVEDSDVVFCVFNAAFAPLQSIYRPTVDTAARQSDRQYQGTRLVAELDRQIVATVQFDSHEEYVHVVGLAVHPDFQRRGIARRLIDWIVSDAASLGHNLIVLDTIRETGNVPLFENLGFRTIHECVSASFESDVHRELHLVKMHRVVR